MKKKRKVIIISCDGGGGHVSTASAITSYLQEQDMIIETIDMGDIFAGVDPFYFVTGHKFKAQDIYNVLLQQNRKKVVNVFFHAGCLLISIIKPILHRHLFKFMKRKKPDIIISVVPVINGFLAKIAHSLQTPYLLIPTDLELKVFIKYLKPPYDAAFNIGIGFDLPEIRKSLENAKIPSSHIKVFGFPIRPNFFLPKNKKKLKNELKISESKPIIMLVMGAQSSKATLLYLHELNKIEIPAHIVICIGRSHTLKNEIDVMQFKEHISYSVVDISYDISNIMAVADLCITKPGTVTFAETLYMNLPVFLDNTKGSLIWEEFNIKFLDKESIGDIISNYEEIASKVSHYLENPTLQESMRSKICALQKKNFGKELRQFVEGILKHKPL